MRNVRERRVFGRREIDSPSSRCRSTRLAASSASRHAHAGAMGRFCRPRVAWCRRAVACRPDLDAHREAPRPLTETRPVGQRDAGRRRSVRGDRAGAHDRSMIAAKHDVAPARANARHWASRGILLFDRTEGVVTYVCSRTCLDCLRRSSGRAALVRGISSAGTSTSRGTLRDRLEASREGCG